MKTLNKIFSLILFFIIANEVSGKGLTHIVPEDKGLIEGRVYDKQEELPVEFANVVVFSRLDSAMVTGGITDTEGKFALAEVPYGEYYMAVQFIGYEPAYIDGISITRQTRRVDLGKVELSMTALQLEAAEVVAERMSVEYRLDRRVINVGRDITAPGSTAVDVLEKAPSVRVDINGDVMLRGSSNYTVLIDGKPSVLDGNEILKQIPAGSIESIEIITNPSARYNPEGTAGIINVIMKKTRLSGLSGVVNATVGTGHKYASDIFINYKAGPFTFYSSIDWNERKFPNLSEERRETYTPSDISIRLSTSDNAWLRNGIRLRGGLDYELSDQTTLSFGGEYGDTGFGMDNFQRVEEFPNAISGGSFYLNDNQFRWTRNFYSLTTGLKHNFGDPGHDLIVYGFFSNRDGSQLQDQKMVYTDANWNSIDTDPFILRSDESGPSKNYRLEVDYLRPFSSTGKLETGYHLRLSRDEETYTVETFDYDQTKWIINDKYSKIAGFRDDIHAVYGIYSNRWKTVDYQFGLRGEHTHRDIEVKNTGDQSVLNKFDLFPTVHLSNRFLDKNQVMASYSRRIQRPRGWFLEPYETYIDENTRRIGNPDLIPEYTNSFEVGYLRTLPAGNLAMDVYHRMTSNKITNIQFVEPENGILYNQFRNINNDMATGIESSLLYDITKWFNLNLSATYYLYQLDDRTIDVESVRTSYNWDTRLIAGIRLWPNTRLQTNFTYNSPTVSAQGTQSENFYTDITLRQDFFERRLNLTLRVSDIFATRSSTLERYGENFYTYEYRKPESRVFLFTVSYRLNNFRPNPERRNGGNMEMEI